MLSPNAAVAVNVHRVDITIWSLAQHRAIYWIMGCETGHISHLCERGPADFPHTMCHNLLQSPRHTNTHTDYSHCHSFEQMHTQKKAASETPVHASN